MSPKGDELSFSDKEARKVKQHSAHNVVVGVRIRPCNKAEIAADMQVTFCPSEDASFVKEMNEDGDTIKNWAYQYVFGPDCSNQYIFHEVGTNLVDSALEGFNAVLFMYGQTSSGKTYTLFGAEEQAGLVGFSMEYLDEKIKSSKDTEYLVKMTYSELYNEELRDLLSETPNENLKIIDDPHLGPLIQNVTEVMFESAAVANRFLAQGEARRHFGVTNMNAHSSRSHVLVRLTIESRKVPFKPQNPYRSLWGKDKPTSISVLNLVDLAGSERSGKAGTSGTSLKEGSFINKSLLTLGTVISNLSEGNEGAHIPYRNSKLTRLLSGALGGNAKTTMIVCVSPASGNLAESQSTLRFAQRAKKIVNKIKKNDILDAKTLSEKLSSQSEMIAELKAKVEKAKDMGYVEDAFDGETIKDKAVAASKSLRSIKFLMLAAPKLVKGLQDRQHFAEAEAFSADLKQALAGKKDACSVVTEGQEMTEKFLYDDHKLISRFQIIEEANASESMYDVGQLFTEEDAVGSGAGECSDDEVEEIGQLFSLQGSNTNPEELELTCMSIEDLQTKATNKISLLQVNVANLEEKVKNFKMQYEEMVFQNHDMKDKLDDANIHHKAYIEDSTKNRTEMKRQMEALRQNMNYMLMKGGETTHVLQDQIDSMLKKIESQDVELSSHRDGKKRLEKEMSFLRSDLAKRIAKETQHTREITKLKASVSQKSIEIRELNSELSTASSLSVLEKNNTRLRQSVKDLSLEMDQKLSLKDDVISDLKDSVYDLNARLEKVQYQVILEKESAEKDTQLNQKITQDLQSELQQAEATLQRKQKEHEEDLKTIQEAMDSLREKSEKRLESLYSQNSKLKVELASMQEKVAEYDSFIAEEIDSAARNRKEVEEAEAVETQEAAEREWYRSQLPDDESLSPSSFSAGTIATSTVPHQQLSTEATILANLSTHQHLRSIREQREYLAKSAPPAPALDDIIPYQDQAQGSKKYQAVRMGISLLKAQLEFTSADFQNVFQFMNAKNKEISANYRSTMQSLEHSLDEVASLKRIKSTLDHTNALALKREREDEIIIGRKDDHISRLKEELASLTIDHVDITEEYKQAVAANEILNSRCKQLNTELLYQKKESEQKESSRQKAEESLNHAVERLYDSQWKCSQREQELAVLQVERDELAKRFYKVDTGEDTFMANAETEMKVAKEGKRKKGRRESIIATTLRKGNANH